MSVSPPARVTDALLPFSRPHALSSVWQLASSLAGFGACWWACLVGLHTSYAITLLATIPAAIFIVRLFIIQHDCAHGAFFASRRLNHLVGAALGVLTLTPFVDWRRQHAMHHATSGNLDQRGVGDIETLTLEEYVALSPARRFRYRVFRHPFVLLVIGPAYQFFVRQRLPARLPGATRQEWMSVLGTNLAAAAVVALMAQVLGLETFLRIQLPISWLASAAGVWLFYVQHQFEGTYWEKEERWSFEDAGLAGSSFYDLPASLHWCSGNIGYHHVHHLCPRIPNYRLPRSMRAHPELQAVTRVTLRQSLRMTRLKLWDEERRRLIEFPRMGRTASSRPR